MHDIKASVILAEQIENNDIKGIIQSLPSRKENIIWMYLTIKTNLEDEDEIKIGFDIIKVDDESDGSNFGIELGEFVVGKTKNKEKRKDILKNHDNAREFKHKKGKSIFPYADIYTIGKKFPPLPPLKSGLYEFVIYEKDEKKNIMLDTFQFEVD